MYKSYVEYIIWIRDPAEYAAALAYTVSLGFQEGQFIHCPATAISSFGLTWPQPVIPPNVSKWITGDIPPFPGPGAEIYNPTASGAYLKSDVDSVIAPGPTQSMLLVWKGNILPSFIPPDSDPPPDPIVIAEIPARRFIGGFEVVSGEGGSGLAAAVKSKSSSRVMDGHGMAIRGTNSPINWLKYQDIYNTGSHPFKTWERFYIRINAFGVGDCGIWKGNSHTSPSAGAHIRISSTGEINIYTVTAFSIETLRATSVLTLQLNKWYLIDTIIEFPTAPAETGRIRVWVNHTYTVGYVDSSSGSLDTVGSHGSSTLGQHTAAEALWSIDLDDWIAADVPNIGGVETLNSADWLLGSHVRVLNIDSGTLTNYAGSIEVCNQYNGPGAVLTSSSALTSSTALASIVANANIDSIYDNAGFTYGIVAALATYYGYSAAGAGTYTLGISIDGAAYEDTTGIAELILASVQWKNILWTLTGEFSPLQVTSISARKIKANDAVLNSTFAFTVVVECIGIWGLEDDTTGEFPDISNNIDLHNNYFSNTIYSNPFLVPIDAPCSIVGGTFTGNGTSQAINLSCLPHMIWIRNVTNPSPTVIWWATVIAPHVNITQATNSSYITRVYVDSTLQAKFVVAGNNATANKNGDIYQYIAFCDPGGRFNRCGTYVPRPTMTDIDVPLWDSDFLAEFGFIHKEEVESTATATYLYSKGVGNAIDNGQDASGVSIALMGNFSPGNLNVLDDIITNNYSGYNYSLWRTTDPDCGDIAVQFTSYVGDGQVFKTINLPLSTGKYPLFACVFPQAGSVLAAYRDPSHTGVNSSRMGTGAIVTTYIMGGAIDQITVGITLNANLAKYEVFVIMGSEDSWENGDFLLANCSGKGPYTDPPYIPPTPGPGGLNFNGSAGILNVQNLSGIYTLVLNKTDDTFYTGINATTNTVKIPDPTFKTGYIGG